MTPSLEIVIVNWNAGKQLRECLASLAESRGASWELRRVVVIDNASHDDSLAGLDVPGVTLELVVNPVNRGFAAACNQGAATTSAEFLLFLNPDTRLEAGSLAVPLAIMTRPESARVGVCGIQLVDETGQVARSCARFPRLGNLLAISLGLPRLTGGRVRGLVMEEWDHAASRPVDHVIGAFYLIRRDLFQQLGGFDERFFVYLEDLDLSLRVHRSGWQIRYLAEARAFHRGGGTSEQVKSTRLYYALSSRILYAYKHLGWMAGTTVLLATLSVEPLLRVAHALLRGDRASIGETLGAYRLLWRALPARLRPPEAAR